MKLPKIAKSKTINVNLGYGLLVACLSAYGVVMKPELIVLLQFILIVAMRYLTKEPMSSK